ncbi:isochorismatase family protein [Candidatus Nitrosocosmicus hydrocola]|uniref:isochorismatase family protein n=1 Tax=Candidatus Nitrosocosmicus hydrocola TaxID=1826872 RepID=UPI0011E5D525|nr:isochorismatase family cysteine hydrolase [Candidatus Nitrosocosmicus hydrocola]
MWTNLARYAILVLDMLNDFIKGSLKCERALEIVPNISTLLNAARNKQIPIFYCVDEHLPTDSYELELWGPHAMKGTTGQQIIDELKPQRYDTVITKRTYSAFDRTNLDGSLTRVYEGKGVDTIIITGVHTHICGKHTSYDAFTRGLKIIIAEDGVQAFSEEDQLSGLEYIRKIYGADIKKIDKIIELLNSNKQ